MRITVQAQCNLCSIHIFPWHPEYISQATMLLAWRGVCWWDEKRDLTLSPSLSRSPPGVHLPGGQVARWEGPFAGRGGNFKPRLLLRPQHPPPIRRGASASPAFSALPHRSQSGCRRLHPSLLPSQQEIKS